MDIEKYNRTQSILNISNKNLDCEEVIKLLISNNIISNVTTNTSIQYTANDAACHIENGCTITLCGLDAKHIEKDVWNPLSKKFGLKCAHLEITGQYKGCIKDFIRKSACQSF